MTLPIEKIDALLAELKSLPPLPKRKRTFMEITGYPHYENVCSNILKFYFQPTNEHGFGALLLNALATLISKEIIIDTQNINVECEVTTKKGNRIDLVIESEDYILGIENKIKAGLYNDFDDYGKHLEFLSKGRQVYKALLLLNPKQLLPDDLKGFCPISYESYFQKVIANIGSHFLTAHEPYITFLRDFIQTIQNLQRSTAMDQERLAYFRKNQQDIVMLLTEVDQLREEMRKKVKHLAEVTATDIAIFPYTIKSRDWQSSRAKSLRGVTWYKFKLNDFLGLQFDVCLTPMGWSMEFFGKPGDCAQVKHEVEARGIEVEYNTSRSRLIYKGENNNLPYETEIDTVRTWTLEMLKRLTAEPASPLI